MPAYLYFHSWKQSCSVLLMLGTSCASKKQLLSNMATLCSTVEHAQYYSKEAVEYIGRCSLQY